MIHQDPQDPFSINVAGSTSSSLPSGASVGNLSHREVIMKHVADLQATAKINQSALNVFKEPSQILEVELLATYGYAGALNQGKMANISAANEEDQWQAAKEVYGSCGPTSRAVMELLYGVAEGDILCDEHAAAGIAIRNPNYTGNLVTAGQKGISGDSMDKLWEVLKDTTMPMATIITLGGSHIYVLETLPRTDLSQPLQAVIHNSCFNSYNLSYWMNKHDGKALVVVEDHLDQVKKLANLTDGMERLELFNEMFQPEGVEDIYLPSIMGGPTLPPATTVWTTALFSRSDVSHHMIDLIARRNIVSP